MNVGRYVFSQVVKYIPTCQFDKCVEKYRGDWHIRDLTCYNQLLHLLSGQLASRDFLRDICLCLDAHKVILYHLSFGNMANQSSLSRADDKSPYTITEVTTLIRVSALEKTPLRELITKLQTSVNFNQYVKELLLFENM